MSKRIRVEIPNTDAYAYTSHEHVDSVLAEWGNPTKIWDEKYGIYRVPAFAASRKKYEKAKLRYCEQYGAE